MRPRYLGVEVAGEPVPRLSPAAWHDLLSRRWRTETAPSSRFRIVRSEGSRAIVMVDQQTLPSARAAWNATIGAATGRTFLLSTVQSWGTLVGAKAWFRASTP